MLRDQGRYSKSFQAKSLAISQCDASPGTNLGGSLFAANGVNLTNAFTNPYSFGAGFSNGGVPPAAPPATSLFANVSAPPAAAAPLFANSLVNHASAILSSSTALTAGHGFVGLADTKEEAKSTMNEKIESARVHGFHGFGSTQDITAGTSDFYGTVAPVLELAISSSNTSTSSENLPVSHEPNADKTESEQSPPPVPMKWQPAIIHISSGDSSGTTTREETTTQNASPLPQTDNLASTNSSEPMEEDEETSTPEAATEIAPTPLDVEAKVSDTTRDGNRRQAMHAGRGYE